MAEHYIAVELGASSGRVMVGTALSGNCHSEFGQ